jgi:hypothetical protein
MAWPSIATPSTVNGAVVKTAHRSKSEAGYVHTRPKWSGDREVFSLGWDLMSLSDLGSLQTAFKADQGSSFSWTNPITSVAHTVIYSDDKIAYKFVKGSNMGFAVVVNLEEP